MCMKLSAFFSIVCAERLMSRSWLLREIYFENHQTIPFMTGFNKTELTFLFVSKSRVTHLYIFNLLSQMLVELLLMCMWRFKEYIHAQTDTHRHKQAKHALQVLQDPWNPGSFQDETSGAHPWFPGYIFISKSAGWKPLRLISRCSCFLSVGSSI